MEFKVLGYHLNIFVIVACVLLVIFLSCFVFLSCVHVETVKKRIKKRFESVKNISRQILRKL